MQIIAEGTYTSGDYWVNVWLYNPWWRNIGFLLCLVLLGLGLSTAPAIRTSDYTTWVPRFFSFVAAGLAAYIYFIVPVRKGMQDPHFTKPIEFRITEASLEYAGTHLKSTIAWTGFVEWKENKQVFLLY